MTKRGSGSAFNILSVLLLGFTALACLCFATIFFVPSLAGPLAVPTHVGVVVLVSATPTIGLPPTWTPTVAGEATETATPIPTYTEGPTETPRSTNTPAPTRTKTVTPGPSPTASPTRSKYPYTADVTYQPSPINACGASYILGTITDLAGQPVTASNMVIRVEGDADIDATLHPGEEFRGKKVQGRSPFTGMGFGPSAWDVVINLSGTSAGTWNVTLVKGGQVSDRIQVHLEPDCVGSSAIVRFQQNH